MLDRHFLISTFTYWLVNPAFPHSNAIPTEDFKAFPEELMLLEIPAPAFGDFCTPCGPLPFKSCREIDLAERLFFLSEKLPIAC